MARSYSTGTILAIAIPLGTVALIGILALTFVIIRMSMLSVSERRAYLRAQHKDFRRRSAASADTSTSLGKQRRSRDRRCWDALCCVPSTAELFPSPSPRSRPGPKQALTDSKDARVRPHEQPIDATPTSAPDMSHATKEPVDTADPDLLVARTAEAIERAEYRSLRALQTQDHQKSPTAEPKPPDAPPLPEAPAPTVPYNSPVQRQRNRQYYHEIGSALSIPHSSYSAHTDVNDPLFVPSIWSYPASLSLNDSLTFNASQPSQLLRAYNTHASMQEGEAENSHEGYGDTGDAFSRLSFLHTPPQNLLAPMPLDGAPLGIRDRQQRFGVLDFSQTPYGRDLGTYDDATDVSPPARSALSNLRTPAASLLSSASLGTGKKGKSAVRTEISDASMRELQTKKTMESLSSRYETPPSVPKESTKPELSSSARKWKPKAEPTPIKAVQRDEENEDRAQINTGVQRLKPALFNGDNVAQLVDNNVRERGQVPESEAVTQTAPIHATRKQGRVLDAEKRTNMGTVEAAHETGSEVMLEAAHEANPEADHEKGQTTHSNNADTELEHQRILGLLNRNEGFLHKGDERAYQQAAMGHATISSYSGSVIRDSLGAHDLSTKLSAEQLKRLRRDQGPPDLSGIYNNASANVGQRPRELLAGPEERARLQTSMTPSAFEKLFNESDLDMSLPLLGDLGKSEQQRTSDKRKSRTSLFLKSGRSRTSVSGSLGSLRISSRSSSLTASTTWASPVGNSGSSNGGEAPETIANRDPTPPKPVRPPPVKTSSSIRSIALLTTPRTPRSPGYIPGQSSPSALAAAANAGSRRPSTDTEHAVAPNVRVLDPTTTDLRTSSHHLLNKPPGHNDEKRRDKKTNPGSPRIRVPKSKRMNKPLPTMPKAKEDGVVTNLKGARYFVTQAYSRKLEDEVSLVPGDIVHVFQVFDDDWCLVRTEHNANTPSKKEICPRPYLKAL